jgi:prevent-host-death family protein
MAESVGVRELRQNLSRYLDRVKAGEPFVVTERGRAVARLVPSGPATGAYGELAARVGASAPMERLEDIVAGLPTRHAEAGTTDAHLADGRADHAR